jgi:putative ABC transport system permease protein
VLSWLRDLRLAARQVLKSPVFAATAILMLALGIGATTAIFSIVEGVLLRPLPFPRSGQLVAISDLLQGADYNGNSEVGVTATDILNYTRDTHSFQSVGAFQPMHAEFSGSGEPAQVIGARFTPGIFSTLGVQPMLGRVFTPQDDEQRLKVAVLSYQTWQNRFHGDRSVLGRRFFLDRKPWVVIGVMPPRFEFPLAPGHLDRSEFWIPMSFTPTELQANSEGNWVYQMIGRLKPGVSPAQAQADAAHVAQETMRNYPAFMAGMKIDPIVPRLHGYTVADARPLLRTLFSAVVVVLLIVCANLAGLYLVRAIGRRREIAVRLALGSGATILLRQALLESLVLSLAGGLLGLALAAAALQAGVRLLPETLPLLEDIHFDWPVAGFGVALAVLTGILCGLIPAFAAIRTNVNETLKEGGRTGTFGAGHARLRSGLVVAEIAVSLGLLAASGILLRSFEKMRDADIGYRPDHTLVAAFRLPLEQYTTQAVVDRFTVDLFSRLRAIPGVRSAGMTSFLPTNGTQVNFHFVPEGADASGAAGFNNGTQVEVDGDYFQAVGTPLLRGRLFTPADNASSPLVVIVNRFLAEECWPGQNPIGKHLRLGNQQMHTPWSVIVGEVDDVKEGSPDMPPREQFYLPASQLAPQAGDFDAFPVTHGSRGYIVLRSALPPELIASQVSAAVRSIDPQLPLTNMRSLDQAIAVSEGPRRFNTVLISSFAATALLLAVLGMYSVIAFTVTTRMQEMAIRMALGAQRSGIIALVLSWGARFAVAGCLLGVAAALFAAHLLRTMVFGISPFDPLVLTLSAVLVLVLALAASVLPALRAASADPARALRSQ